MNFIDGLLYSLLSYFSRHSGTKKRGEAKKLEKKKSKGYYNAKILSHIYLFEPLYLIHSIPFE